MGFLEALKLSSGRVTRAKFNALLAALDAALELGGAAGVGGSFTSSGLMLAITDGKGRWDDARIVEAPPYGVPILPSACKYSVQKISKGAVIPLMLPVYGRPCFGDDVHIYPAKVGHACKIYRNTQGAGVVVAELAVFTEFAVRGGCT